MQFRSDLYCVNFISPADNPCYILPTKKAQRSHIDNNPDKSIEPETRYEIDS